MPRVPTKSCAANGSIAAAPGPTPGFRSHRSGSPNTNLRKQDSLNRTAPLLNFVTTLEVGRRSILHFALLTFHFTLESNSGRHSSAGLKEQIGIEVKTNNRKLAERMTVEEIVETDDLYKFLKKVEKRCMLVIGQRIESRSSWSTKRPPFYPTDSLVADLPESILLCPHP